MRRARRRLHAPHATPSGHCAPHTSDRWCAPCLPHTASARTPHNGKRPHATHQAAAARGAGRCTRRRQCPATTAGHTHCTQSRPCRPAMCQAAHHRNLHHHAVPAGELHPRAPAAAPAAARPRGGGGRRGSGHRPPAPQSHGAGASNLRSPPGGRHPAGLGRPRRPAAAPASGRAALSHASSCSLRALSARGLAVSRAAGRRPPPARGLPAGPGPGRGSLASPVGVWSVPSRARACVRGRRDCG